MFSRRLPDHEHHSASAGTGKVTVSFAVLSYAGSLTVTLIADADTCPDLPELRDVLEEEFQVLVST